MPLTKTGEFRQTPGGAAKGLYADEPEASLTAKLESATELVSEDRSIVTYSEIVTQSTDDESSVQSGASQPSNASRFVMLIQQVANDQDLDEPLAESDRRWHASPHARFERLLRETQVPAGLLTNGRSIRLVYAPRGETSGYLTFNVDEMITVAGRPIFAAFHMLLNADRLFNLEKKQRLPAILAESRKYQNTVSTQLAQQVMAALYEFLRGFQAADDQWNGRLLKDVLAHDPQHVYHGLLTVLMRTVFVLYAEDRNLLSNHPVYTNYYSITGLFERLRADAGQYPDTMDQRYGAWAQLLTLFRMIYEGGNHDDLRIPPRKGYLFDPNRYPFLEGVRRENTGSEDTAFPTAIPRVSDGVAYRVLNNLLMLDGERLSYRSLDVEQIGSVYEAIMGFEVELSTGRSIAIKPVKKHGAPATINLEELLKQKSGDRAKWLKERSDQDLSGNSLDALKSAGSIEELLAALGNKIANEVTPNVVPTGAMIFQPSDERRRSGSHYTPRSLTEPIVRTTLEPILKQLVTPFSPASGEKVADKPDEGAGTSMAPAEPQVWQPTAKDKKRFTGAEIAERIRLSRIRVANAQAARTVGTPHPSQILDLKICDPAMGSGAFLVEACRQLGDELIKAWYAHDAVPTGIPPDEDEVLYARRLIAQRCLYGVDKNAMAVDLAKLSLWLVTLAKDHAFTFLDHALRHGDSLVGLTREQIIGFHWEVKKQKKFGEDLIQRRLDRATEARAKILNAREDVPYRDQESRMASADEALDLIRLVGDACVSGFFAGQKKKEREEEVERIYGLASSYLSSISSKVVSKDSVEETLTTSNQQLTTGGVAFASRKALQAAADRLQSPPHPIPAFHWEIEFPEVFARENGGFDAFVGNPPFAGKNNLINGNREGYLDWLKNIHEETHGNSDLVAHFFRRTFQTLRHNGCLGLITTKTARQGDTRTTGLGWICQNHGSIFAATRRMAWPGQAAVVISIVHLSRGIAHVQRRLDGKPVERITSYLVTTGSDEQPQALTTNEGKSFIGCYLLGMGFTFDDSDKTGNANPLSEMTRLTQSCERNRQRIFPYIGGEEVNDDPHHRPTRFVIDFADMSEDAAREWPDLFHILELRVKPQRLAQKDKYGQKHWWQFLRPRMEMRNAIAEFDRYLVCSRIGNAFAFTFIAHGIIPNEKIVVFPFSGTGAFCVIQSRVHEIWARFFSTTLKDDLQYTSSACFDNFAFPLDFETSETLVDAGGQYFAARRNWMEANDDGLTDTYNRFHSPHEQSEGILELRRLHGLMDGAVLRAYGWDDLAESARCEFLLDYEDGDQVSGDGGQGEDSGPDTRSLTPGPRRRKRLPWRLRWPDEFRDEVLARLLELNEQRHKEELLAGKSATSKRVSSDNDDEDGEDDDDDTVDSDDAPTPKKSTRTTKAGRSTKKTKKSKKPPASGQKEMEF